MQFSTITLVLALTHGAISTPWFAPRADCVANNCARAVTGTRDGLKPPAATRQADCASYLAVYGGGAGAGGGAVTVTPAASVSVVTVTATVGSPLRRRMNEDEVEKRQLAPGVPAYASACTRPGQYASACSCAGVTGGAGTVTLPASVSTRTVTITSTTSTTAPTTITTTTSTSSTTTSTSSTSTTSAPVCPIVGTINCAVSGQPANCVNPLTSPLNCGACGVACPAGSSCTGGLCGVAVCPIAGQTNCAGAGLPAVCSNQQIDPFNCGACGVTCGAGTACVAGVCVGPATCAIAGQTNCAAAGLPAVCSNQLIDFFNCGSCGNVCPAGTNCSNGSCGPVGLVNCNAPGTPASFVNLNLDVLNCGTCGTLCGPNILGIRVCTLGVCIL